MHAVGCLAGVLAAVNSSLVWSAFTRGSEGCGGIAFTVESDQIWMINAGTPFCFTSFEALRVATALVAALRQIQQTWKSIHRGHADVIATWQLDVQQLSVL